MKAISELDEDDTDVRSHGEKHAPQQQNLTAVQRSGVITHELAHSAHARHLQERDATKLIRKCGASSGTGQ